VKKYLAVSVIALVGVTVLAGLAYLVGYWPEHRRRQAIEGQVTSLEAQLADAQARVRLGSLLGQLLAAEDAVSAQNYGQAQTLASTFFDAVRAEGERTPPGSFKDTLAKIVQVRDPITASLTRGDPQALTLLLEADTQLRNELGFPRSATGRHVAAPAGRARARAGHRQGAGRAPRGDGPRG